MAESGIYEIFNLVNGKRYVGSSLNFRQRWHSHQHRLRQGIHHSPHLQAAWKKYGEDSFEFRVLEYCPRETLLEREQHHIDMGCDYNKALVAGSPLGVKHSDATRKKMSEQRKGRKLTDTHILAMANASRERWADEEYRTRLSASIQASYDEELRMVRSKLSRDRWSDPEYRRRMSDTIKATHAPDRRASTSEKSKARWANPEYRANVVESLKGREVSADTRAKISASLTGKKFSEELSRSRAKLTDFLALEVLRRRAAGESYQSIAESFGVGVGLIGRICRRERYAWLPA